MSEVAPYGHDFPFADQYPGLARTRVVTEKTDRCPATVSQTSRPARTTAPVEETGQRTSTRARLGVGQPVFRRRQAGPVTGGRQMTSHSKLKSGTGAGQRDEAAPAALLERGQETIQRSRAPFPGSASNARPSAWPETHTGRPPALAGWPRAPAACFRSFRQGDVASSAPRRWSRSTRRRVAGTPDRSSPSARVARPRRRPNTSNPCTRAVRIARPRGRRAGRLSRRTAALERARHRTKTAPKAALAERSVQAARSRKFCPVDLHASHGVPASGYRHVRGLPDGSGTAGAAKAASGSSRPPKSGPGHAGRNRLWLVTATRATLLHRPASLARSPDLGRRGWWLPMPLGRRTGRPRQWSSSLGEPAHVGGPELAKSGPVSPESPSKTFGRMERSGGPPAISLRGPGKTRKGSSDAAASTASGHFSAGVPAFHPLRQQVAVPSRIPNGLPRQQHLRRSPGRRCIGAGPTSIRGVEPARTDQRSVRSVPGRFVAAISRRRFPVRSTAVEFERDQLRDDAVHGGVPMILVAGETIDLVQKRLSARWPRPSRRDPPPAPLRLPPRLLRAEGLGASQRLEIHYGAFLGEAPPTSRSCPSRAVQPGQNAPGRARDGACIRPRKRTFGAIHRVLEGGLRSEGTADLGTQATGGPARPRPSARSTRGHADRPRGSALVDLEVDTRSRSLDCRRLPVYRASAARTDLHGRVRRGAAPTSAV